MRIIIVPSTVIMRIKWVIIWKYLKSGNTSYYISVCFYDMTISCLDYWNSLLIDLLASSFNLLKSLYQDEVKGIFPKWIFDYDFFFCSSLKWHYAFLMMKFKLLNTTFTWALNTYLAACLSTLLWTFKSYQHFCSFKTSW